MTKRIDTLQLKPGMYITEFGGDWDNHPCLPHGILVTDDATIEKIAAAGIRQVYIDPGRGLDAEDAPTSEEIDQQLVAEMLRAPTTPVLGKQVSRVEEMGSAKHIHAEVNKTIHNVMQNVRMGQQVRTDELEPLIERIAESIFRNSGALLSLTQIKKKDDYTFLHSVAVCALQVSFCRSIGLDAQTTHLAGIGGLLHDIGKVRIPIELLNKPCGLTKREYAVMRRHADESKRILEQTTDISAISIEVAYQHHERYDGSGYPQGLKGNAISQMGRMAAICDIYDAITSDRCYHKAVPPHMALRRIFEWGQFNFLDPALVQQFLRAIGIYPVGTLVRLESGRIGVVLEQADDNLLQPVVRVFYDCTRIAYISPEDVDLSRPLGHGGGDRIAGYETAERWGVDPKRFL